MNKHSPIPDDQTVRQNPEPAAIDRDKTALSDDALEQVSGAGDIPLTAIFPYVMPDEHDIPDDAGEKRT